MQVRIRIKPEVRKKMQADHMKCGGHKVNHAYQEFDIDPKYLEGKGPAHWFEWSETDKKETEKSDLREPENTGKAEGPKGVSIETDGMQESPTIDPEEIVDNNSDDLELGAMNANEVIQLVESSENTDDLEMIKNQEFDGKNRKGVMSAITLKLAELEFGSDQPIIE